MQKEQKTLMVSALINFLVFGLKLLGGLLFKSYTLIMDGIYTFSDLVTDILAMIGAKIGRKRANKKHPFGYGRFEYIMQIFTGMIILLVGLYLLIKSFFITAHEPDLRVLFIVILTILLKGLSSNYLMKVGKDISSVILISSAKESFLDCISSLLVFIFILIGQFFPPIDIIGSAFIALLIIIEGIKIIFDNVILLIGQDDNNKELKMKIKEIINKDKKVKYADSFLIKSGSYYQATIAIIVSDNMSVKDLIRKEKWIKKEIKKSKLRIKFIDFLVNQK